MRWIGFLIAFQFVAIAGWAQTERSGFSIICLHNDTVQEITLLPPANWQDELAPLSEFVFDFSVTVPVDAREAIRKAGDIWSRFLISPIPIRVSVDWQELEPQSLAGAGPTTLFRGLNNVANPFVWYPVALAEAIEETSLNDPGQPDINITINDRDDWYLGTDGNPARNQFDLSTVILHELAHGLGFLSSSDVPGDTIGQIGFDNIPISFDQFLATGDNRVLTNPLDFDNPSVELLEAFTNQDLFYRDATVAAANGGEDPEIFAPSVYESGSSISHIDEFIFRSAETDALMTPRLSFAEVIQYPGVLTLRMMESFGWPVRLVTSTGHAPIATMGLRLFPNPANDRVRIFLPNDPNTSGQLTIFDLTGRPIAGQNLRVPSGASINLPVAGYRRGIYLIEWRGPQKTYRTRLVKP